MGESPRISIIVAARVGQSEIAALAKLMALPAQCPDFEILIARGTQPSCQRNRAAEEAQGEILYFLDDDSLLDEGNLERVLVAFSDPKLAVVGGPNLCPADAPFRQKLFAAVMGSRLAFGPSAARYRQIGGIRMTTEKELILCNMAVRARDFKRAGGFDEALYPNEENALLDLLARDGRQLRYDPELLVFRHPRESVLAFVWMLFRYGRGRGEQVRLHPSLGSALNFVPALFVCYTILFLFSSLLSDSIRFYAQLPMFFYLLVATFWGLNLARHHGLKIGFCGIPFLPVAHVAYGVGLWKGLFVGPAGKSDREQAVEVSVERICSV